MNTGLVHFHNLLRWVVLLLLLVTILRHLAGMTGKKPFTDGDKKADLFLMISGHIQLLLGIILWFIGDFGLNLTNNGMGEVMKDAASRFWVVEHPVGMLIAVALITVGKGVAKKNIPDHVKHKKAFWFFLIALILILASVPWPGREVGRPMI